jgi:hypothetical protein
VASGGSWVCPSGAYHGSRARQEVLRSLAQEQRRLRRPEVGLGGDCHIACQLDPTSASLPQTGELGSSMEAQRPPL